LTRLEQFFSGTDRTLVTTHINPDGDAIGSVLAVCQFLEQRDIPAFPVIDSEIPRRFAFLPGCDQIKTPKTRRPRKPFEWVIILDIGTQERIGNVRNLIAVGAKIANIDHHLSNPGFGDVNILRPECSATTEVLWDVAQSLGLTINASIATNLYTGIFTDTGRFQFSNTSARALKICAELVSLGAKPEIVADEIYFHNTFDDIKRTGELLSEMQLHDHGRISAIRLHHINEVQDTDAVLDMALSIKGVCIAVLIAPIPGGKSKVSLRSKNHVDVRVIAESFGGGGHPKAAGFRFRIDPDDMQEKLIPILAEALDNNTADFQE
jgi:phosphoesterase RecJ-like protein